MQIRMRYFAALREITGLNEENLDVPEQTTVADERARLLARFPSLENALARAVCAVNHRYVPPETLLQEGDEIVFIPPVGGGAALPRENIFLKGAPAARRECKKEKRWNL